jgi:hypothetical protein
MECKYKTLSAKLFSFLDEFAGLNADYDPEFDDKEESFSSPDAGCLFVAARILETGKAIPQSFYVDSSWESGGYFPYNDPRGKKLHSELIVACNAIKLNH